MDDVYKSSVADPIGSPSPPADSSIIPDESKLDDKVEDVTKIDQSKLLDRLPRMSGINPNATLEDDEFYGILDFDAWS